MFVSLLFAIYNAYLGIRYYDAFGIGISIYYFLLIFIRFSALIVEKSVLKDDDITKGKKRKRYYFFASIFIFVIDFCLIAPIILMVIHPRDFNLGMIPAITVATYTTYKIFISINNYKKSNKTSNLTIILLREINVLDAMVSILTLQRILIMSNGGMTNDMRTLSLTSSVAILILIISFSIMFFIKNIHKHHLNS